MKNIKMRWFILMPGLAMWLGWGIRGEIGHFTGAMIPGAFLALALCILLQDKQISRGLVIGLTAASFGFGAQMTTMQSVGMVLGFYHPPVGSMALGCIGLAIKGALWALFGGAGLGLALAASRYRRKDIILALIFMVASFYVGWALIDRPKLLYLAVDRPEIWAGLLFAAILLLTWLTVRGRTRIPLVLALCGVAAGGIGYPIGATLARIGQHSSYMDRWYDGWKVAKTTFGAFMGAGATFGAFMGAGLGLGTYFLKDKLPDAEKFKDPAAETGFSAWGVILGLAISELWIALHGGIPWIIFAPILVCLAFYSSKAAWHVGITLTYCGSAANVVIYLYHEQGLGNAAVFWVLAGLATLGVSWKVTTWWGKTDKVVARNAFVFVMWAILILEYVKIFISRAVLLAPADAVAAAGGRCLYMLETWFGGLFVVFTVAALVLTWMAFRTSRAQELPGR
jgi:hypothetical protein